jgi:hypothetical protein
MIQIRTSSDAGPDKFTFSMGIDGLDFASITVTPTWLDGKTVRGAVSLYGFTDEHLEDLIGALADLRVKREAKRASADNTAAEAEAV